MWCATLLEPARVAPARGELSVPISPFYSTLRERVGSALLLMPSVAALVRDAHGRLLVQQIHDGRWGLPGGAIEPGETPSLAVQREVLEETGLHVRPTRVAGVVGGSDCHIRYGNGHEVEYTVIVFDCQIVGGDLITSNEETRSLAWLHRTDLPELALRYPDEVFAGGGATYFAAEAR